MEETTGEDKSKGLLVDTRKADLENIRTKTGRRQNEFMRVVAATNALLQMETGDTRCRIRR